MATFTRTVKLDLSGFQVTRLNADEFQIDMEVQDHEGPIFNDAFVKMLSKELGEREAETALDDAANVVFNAQVFNIMRKRINVE